MEGVTNTLVNAVQPVDLRYLDQVQGAVEFVTSEVFVSYMARWLFKLPKRTVMELAAIHTVSIAFNGGLQGAFKGHAPLGYESGFLDLFQDGAKGIPAVYAAQYVCNTALQGLHAPKLNFTDILVTAATKLVTRPLVSLVYPFIGDFGRKGFDVIEELTNKQRAASVLTS